MTRSLGAAHVGQPFKFSSMSLSLFALPIFFVRLPTLKGHKMKVLLTAYEWIKLFAGHRQVPRAIYYYCV
jgi:hypothetical protein